FSSRRRHTRSDRDWSSDVCSSDLIGSPALLPAWAELSPGEELAERLGMPVRLENDANLGALGEHVWGAGRGCADLVYVKIATGRSEERRVGKECRARWASKH